MYQFADLLSLSSMNLVGPAQPEILVGQALSHEQAQPEKVPTRTKPLGLILFGERYFEINAWHPASSVQPFRFPTLAGQFDDVRGLLAGSAVQNSFQRWEGGLHLRHLGPVCDV